MTFDWREPLELGERWFQEVAETNILKVTADIKAPILAINGKDDTTVTPDNAEKIVKAAANADSQLLLVDNCDHTYNVFSGDFTDFLDWLDRSDLIICKHHRNKDRIRTNCFFQFIKLYDTVLVHI